MNPHLRFDRTVFALISLGCAGCATSEADPFARFLEPLAASTRSGPKHVEFELGRAKFSRGDSVMIERVTSTSTRWGPGDTVIVRGHYTLTSQADAVLGLHVTATEPGSGRSRTSPNQRQSVAKGTGEFELSVEIPYNGNLHVSFYPTGGGSSFGGIYFHPRNDAR